MKMTAWNLERFIETRVVSESVRKSRFCIALKMSS